MDNLSCAPVRQETDLIDVIRSRRTTHRFRPDVPSPEVIRRAVEAACWAPNHKLTQPWRFYLLGPDTAARVVALNTELVRARWGEAAARDKQARWEAIPGWLVVTCRRSDDPLRAREDYAACCCAVQNLMLVLWQEGVGAKWGTGAVTRDPRLLSLIGADPATEEVVGLFSYGYPADVPPPPPRKPVETVLVERP
ncbi:MAG: putative NAD(P)H nitroreductase YfhC [Rhodothermaceae bacterium]|nr:MAG: putative NAD(P)H nitroreductase YfhC [Rhodothermaceae bacterium]